MADTERESLADASETLRVDERRLVDGLLTRNPRAISEFLERTHHAVFSMACRLTRDPDLRRDWSHSTLLGFLEDLERGRFVYRRPGSFWAWFRKRAYFRLLDEYRRHRRGVARTASSGLEGDESELSRVAGGPDPVDEMERVELLGAVEACLKSIPNDEQRRALGLLLLDDMAYQDIAEAMSAPLNTIRAWIRRGRLRLRSCMAKSLGLNPPEELEAQ